LSAVGLTKPEEKIGNSGFRKETRALCEALRQKSTSVSEHHSKGMKELRTKRRGGG